MADQVTPGATDANQADSQNQTSEQEVPQEQAQEQQQEEPKYVTEESLLHALDERDRRLKQGDRDRAKRIADQLATIKNSLQQRGQTLTGDQEAAFKASIEEQYDAVKEAQASAPHAKSQQLHPAVERAYGIMEKRGVTIEPTDPEFEKFVKPELDKGPKGLDEDDLALATENAIKEKQARLASNKQKASLRAANSGGGQQRSDGVDLDKPASYYLDKAEEKRTR